MFLNFYGLREQPFGVTPDPRYLYLFGIHGQTLASLLYAIESNLGFSALIAQPGLGKTTLLFHILEKFRSSAVTAFVFQTQCNSTGFVKYVLQELDIQLADSDQATMHQQLEQALVNAALSGRQVILIIDEAQNLVVIDRNGRLADTHQINNARNRQQWNAVSGVQTAKQVAWKQRKFHGLDSI